MRMVRTHLVVDLTPRIGLILMAQETLLAFLPLVPLSSYSKTNNTLSGRPHKFLARNLLQAEQISLETFQTKA